MKQWSKTCRTKAGILILTTVLLVVGAGGVQASADVPYNTYTFNGENDIMRTQTAYLPYETLNKFGEEAFSKPSDLCVTDEGEIYVADTGNSRILVGDLEGSLIKIIGEGTLKTPKGVYVTKDQHIYVADRDLGAILEFSSDGEVLNTYTRPDSPLYGDDISFLPIKVVVNDAGIMFVICESNTNGIVEISPNEGGTFLGYFGTNNASKSLQTIIYRAILNDAQRAKMVSNLPSTPDNLAIDSKGLIYTVTRGDQEETLKRLNIAGTNIYSTEVYDSLPSAVAAGNHDNVLMVSQDGYIYEYNNEGELLFVFGGQEDGTQRVGLSVYSIAIDVDIDDRIYLLDSDRARIQVYEPTEFTQLLHTALYLYSKGRYTESKAPLEEVLAMNSMYTYANKAMGRAYFQEENYEMALNYARIAKDKSGYSDAYWEVRNIWLKKNIVPLVFSIVGLFVLIKIISLLNLKKHILAGAERGLERISQIKLVKHTGFAWRFMRHPIDGSYELSRQGMASVSAANLLLLIGIVEFLLNKYICGFIEKRVNEGQYEIIQDAGTIVLVLLVVTACHYLVCTINDGEGTLKKIYCYLIYSFTPYITLSPVVLLLSYMVTNNEEFLITLTKFIMYGWVIILLILAIKEVNNYTAKETFKIICLTLFTILIMILLVFIIYVLWAQVFEFISAIVGEVVYRLGF